MGWVWISLLVLCLIGATIMEGIEKSKQAQEREQKRREMRWLDRY